MQEIVAKRSGGRGRPGVEPGGGCGAGHWLRLGVAGLALLLLLACGGGPVVTETREDSFTVSGRPKLEVEISNGSITIGPSQGTGVIDVTATIRSPERVDYLVGQVGDTVTVIGDIQGGIGLFKKPEGVDVHALAPKDVDLELKTSNGRINVASVGGLLTAESSNGRITVSDVQGDAEIKTSNGNIEVTGFSGQIQASTSNGSIKLAGKLDPGSQNELHSSNGDVEVTLVDTAGVKLDASTNNGEVRSDLPITTSGVAGKEKLVGVIGDGGSILKIETSNGSIRIQ